MKITTLFAVGGALLLVGGGAARADLEPLHKVDTAHHAVEGNRFATACVKSLARLDYGRALSECEQGLAAAPDYGWLHYDRAEALVGLGRVDEALPEYGKAEALFTPSDTWARSVARWGRANALYNVGRCNEASQAFQSYSELVQPLRPEAAQLALARVNSCRIGPTPERVPVGGTQQPARPR